MVYVVGVVKTWLGLVRWSMRAEEGQCTGRPLSYALGNCLDGWGACRAVSRDGRRAKMAYNDRVGSNSTDMVCMIRK